MKLCPQGAVTSMAGGYGNDPREGRPFDTGNVIRFEIEVDEAGRDWWRENFLDRHQLTPEGVGEALSASWKGDRRMTVTELDGRRQRFAIRVDGGFGDGDFWFHARTVDLHGSFVNADRMFVSPDKRGTGVGRAFIKPAQDTPGTAQSAWPGRNARPSSKLDEPS